MLDRFVSGFASGLLRADQKRPQWISTKTGKPYLPGVGPHTESKTIDLVLAEWAAEDPPPFDNPRTGVAYPAAPRQKCDLLVDCANEEWALEIKMLRFMGDNGRPDDNILMHILSQYPAHRSALTDTTKLSSSAFPCRKAVVIFGYDYPAWPMDPAIEALELRARARVALGARSVVFRKVKRFREEFGSHPDEHHFAWLKLDTDRAWSLELYDALGDFAGVGGAITPLRTRIALR